MSALTFARRITEAGPARRFRRAPPATPAPSATGLSARGIHHNLEATTNGVYAWFSLGDVFWNVQGADQREVMLASIVQRWVEQRGHRIHLRTIAEPIPYKAIARTFYEDHLADGLEDVPGAESREDLMVAVQQRVAERQGSESTRFIGIRFSTLIVPALDLHKLRSPEPLIGRDANLEKARLDFKRVTESVARDGFLGEPLSVRGLGWLVHASRTIGIKPDADTINDLRGGWGENDLETFTASVTFEKGEEWDDYCAVHTSRGGKQASSYVSILSVSSFDEAHDAVSPGSPIPWMAYNPGVPIEWSAIFDIQTGKQAKGGAAFQRNRMRDQAEGFIKRNEQVPPEVERAYDAALRSEDEKGSTDPTVSTTIAGYFRIAVSASSLDELHTRRSHVISDFADRQHIHLELDPGQRALYNEFTPGESPLPIRLSTMPAAYLASAVPNARTRIGHEGGYYLGGNGPHVFWYDPMWGPRNDQSGVCLLVGAMGFGKTTLAGAKLEMAARMGHVVRLFDPSGKLARKLAKLPHLAPYSRIVDLAVAPDGTFNPYTMIPDPRTENYDTHDEWVAARRAAFEERRELMVEVGLGMQLATSAVTVEERAELLREAVEACPSHFGATPWDVLDWLTKAGKDKLDAVGNVKVAGNKIAASLASTLTSAATQRLTRLVFPSRESTTEERANDDLGNARIVFFVFNVDMPDATNPADWTPRERTVALVASLGARYAIRSMYSETGPKTIVVDEFGLIGSGRTAFGPAFRRGAVETRKMETDLTFIVQNLAMAEVLGKEFGNLIGTLFLGHCSIEVARAVLRVMDRPDQVGFERTAPTLSKGQFQFFDWPADGNNDHRHVASVEIDVRFRPQLFEALSSTPPVKTRLVKVPAPVLPPEGAIA